MGMSASQVRFLSLQHRKHNVGRQLNALSNRKMALSRDMQQVSRNYTNALNQIHFKFSNNCGINTYDLSYDTLMKPNKLNAETPLILTDKEGRVVVDDNEITYERNGETVHTGVTYRQLAELISSYSDVDDKGTIIYGNTSRLTGFSGSLLNEDGSIKAATATSGLACSVNNGYKIAMSNSDIDFDTYMRYDILRRLGIASADEIEALTVNQEELYGSKEAKDANLYGSLTINDGIGTAKYLNDLMTSNPESYQIYKNTFGILQVDENGALSFGDTGCVMGNLELAKMYLEEYENYYLNTVVKQRATGDAWAYRTADGNNRVVDIDDYKYENYPVSVDQKEGVTTRIYDLLVNNRAADQDGVDSDGIYKAGVKVLDNTTIKFSDMFKGNCGYQTNGVTSDHDGSGDSGISNVTGFWYYKNYDDRTRVYGSDNSSGNADVNLNWFFDYNGDTTNGTNEGHGDIYAGIADIYVDGDSGWNSDADTLNCNAGNLYSLVDSIRVSIINSQSQGKIDTTLRQNAGDFAKYMTIAKFMNNDNIISGTEHAGGATNTYDRIKNNIEWTVKNPNKFSTSNRRNEDYTIFAQTWKYYDTSFNRVSRSIYSDWSGYGDSRATSNGISSATSDEGGTQNWVEFFVNMPNLINTFVTFYTAYIETNIDKEDPSTWCNPDVIWKDRSQQIIGSDSVSGSTTSSTERDSNLLSRFGITNYSASVNNWDWPKNSDGTLNGVTTRYYDSNDKYYYEWEDKDNNNKDDKTGRPASDFTGVVWVDSDNDGKHDEFGITQASFDYLKQYIPDKKENSEEFNYDIKTGYRDGDKKSTDPDVIADLDKLIGYSDENPESADYHLLKKILRKIKENVATHYVTSSEAAYRTETKTITTHDSEHGDITATATRKINSAGKVVSFTVEYQYDKLKGGETLKYEETYDSNGKFTGSKTTQNKASGIKTLDNVNTGNPGGHQDWIVACQISTGKSTYVIGRGANWDTTYANYMYTTLEDSDNYIDKFKALINNLTERKNELTSSLQLGDIGFERIENKTMEFFDALFKRISENGWVYDDKVNNKNNQKASDQYLDSMLQNNQYFITEAKEINEYGRYQFATKQASSVNKIYNIHDEDAENAALAKYESDKTAINTKERQIDMRMSMLETEQEAINTELESIKKVRNDNIEKYFKIFA